MDNKQTLVVVTLGQTTNLDSPRWTRKHGRRRPSYRPNNLGWLPHLRSQLRAQPAGVVLPTACIAGSVAGILGLTNLHGFVLFFITSFGVGALYSAVNCGMKPSRYFPKASEPLLSGTLGNCFSFILFWTLFYSLVHIYK
ncbi:hypothetical protein NBRC10512_008031 [Rhodotorula toruloides]